MGEHLTSFGSIVAVTGDFEAAATLMMASSTENAPSPNAGFSDAINMFSKLEEQSFNLAISLYGKDWDKVAKLVGRRTALEAELFFSQHRQRNPALEELSALGHDDRFRVGSMLRGSVLQLLEEEDVSRKGAEAQAISQAIEKHAQGLVSDTELIETAFLAFGKENFLAKLDLSVLVLPEKKVTHDHQPLSNNMRQQMTPEHSDGFPPWPASFYPGVQQQTTPPSSRTSGKRRAGTPQRQSSDYAHGENMKVCANCGTSNTPLWRKEAGQHMCNACGIYYKNHGYHRPVDLIKTSSRQGGGSAMGGGRSKLTGGGLSCDVTGIGHHEDTATSPLAKNSRSRRSPFHPSHPSMRLMAEDVVGEAGCSFEFDAGGEVATAPHSNLGVSGGLQGLRGPADLLQGGSSRRSGRRRAAKNLGKEWLEPDELIFRQDNQAASRHHRQHVGHVNADSESEYLDEAVSGGPAISGLYGDPDAGSEGMPAVYQAPGESLAGYNLRRALLSGDGYEKRASHLSGTFPHVASRFVAQPEGSDLNASGMYQAEVSGIDAAGSAMVGAEEAGDTSDSSDLTDLRVDDDVTHVATALLKLKQAYYVGRSMAGGRVDMHHGAVHGDYLAGVKPIGDEASWLESGPLPLLQHPSDGSPLHAAASGYEEEEDVLYEEGEEDYDDEDRLLMRFTRKLKADAGRARKRGRSYSRRSSAGGASCGPVTRRPSPDSRNGGGNTTCANCGTSKTPLWRKDRETGLTMCNACGIYKQTHGYDRSVDGTRSGGDATAVRKRTSQSGPRHSGGGGGPRRTSSHGSPSVGQAPPTSPYPPLLNPSSYIPARSSPLSGRPPLAPPRSGARPIAAAHSSAAPTSRYYEESLQYQQYQPYPLDAASPLLPAPEVEQEAQTPGLEGNAEVDAQGPDPSAACKTGGWGSPVHGTEPHAATENPPLSTQQQQQQQQQEVGQQRHPSAQHAAQSSSLTNQQQLALLQEHQMAMLLQMRQAEAFTEMQQQQQQEQLMHVAMLRQLKAQHGSGNAAVSAVPSSVAGQNQGSASTATTRTANQDPTHHQLMMQEAAASGSYLAGTSGHGAGASSGGYLQASQQSGLPAFIMLPNGSTMQLMQVAASPAPPQSSAREKHAHGTPSADRQQQRHSHMASMQQQAVSNQQAVLQPMMLPSWLMNQLALAQQQAQQHPHSQQQQAQQQALMLHMDKHARTASGTSSSQQQAAAASQHQQATGGAVVGSRGAASQRQQATGGDVVGSRGAASQRQQAIGGDVVGSRAGAGARPAQPPPSPQVLPSSGSTYRDDLASQKEGGGGGGAQGGSDSSSMEAARITHSIMQQQQAALASVNNLLM
ncbi:hypothetical protein CEUSTIGMA_g2748.t1 [Chlamydomonas eustigma]|uniref:GATA-type domain-containing protein n=1 Tax=Chlamydomonas eustigma TaxID=1157962 RepID=A0A250WWS6_9CHLO|nr:hypothetical protein CEUSTIGMA_g2748.t1 [Chlamydomonas eustigma]|eukprot:GAX75303.1 hypothetical protein CEUSTIGMA_g2748.t1 [Chlamydomonas eustigma]